MPETELGRRVTELREYMDRRFSEHAVKMQLTDDRLNETRLSISGLVTRADLKLAFKEFEERQAVFETQKGRSQDRLRPYISGIVVGLMVIAFAAWAAGHGFAPAHVIGGNP